MLSCSDLHAFVKYKCAGGTAIPASINGKLFFPRITWRSSVTAMSVSPMSAITFQEI